MQKDLFTKCLEEIDTSLKNKGSYTVYFNKPDEYKTNCNISIAKDIIYEYMKRGATYTPYVRTVYFEGLSQTDSIIGFKLDGSHISNK